MKRILLILLSLALLTSCTGKKEADDGHHKAGNNEEKREVEPVDKKEEPVEEDPFVAFEQTVTPIETWSLEGGGSYRGEVNKKFIHLSGGNDDIYGIVLKSSPIMLKNGDYTVSFKIITDIDKTIYFNIDDYINVSMDVKQGTNEYAFIFNNPGDTVYEATASFCLGDKSSIDQHIEINDFSIASKTRTIGARIDQVGYLSGLEKQVVFTYNQGNYFMVCDAGTDKVVYCGPISESIYENDSDEYLHKGFFKNVARRGTYYIRTEYGAYSYEFKIGDDVYDELSKDALRFLYLQRCGYTISREDSEILYHEACHTSETKIYTSLGDYYIDTVGGWHDAGDYGRYVQTSNKVLADLLFSYMFAGNRSSQLIDEIRWGLEWSLKMQRPDGGVYNKVSTRVFADFVLPENDNSQLFALWPWTLTTASFAGVMGLAYELYEDSDPDFAETCLDAHQRAISYLNAHPDQECDGDPEDFSTGFYSPGNEADERLFAYAVAYRISEDGEYLKKVKDLIKAGIPKEDNCASFRLYDLVLLLETLDKKDDIYKDIKEALRSDCEQSVECINSNVYSYALYNYSSGSDQYHCEAISGLIMGYKYLHDERYLVKASEAFNYLLGMNTLDMSFVYGYGRRYPANTHSRLANVKGTTIKGALAGGVCELLTEGKISNYFDENTPIAKRFADAQDSYNNTEPAIYYNSAFILALSLLKEANHQQ